MRAVTTRQRLSKGLWSGTDTYVSESRQQVSHPAHDKRPTATRTRRSTAGRATILYWSTTTILDWAAIGFGFCIVAGADSTVAGAEHYRPAGPAAPALRPVPLGLRD
jgi:hypothetical protein